jgi:hypothetical protein
MAMKRCPICGEKYSDTYKTCPFCEEEEAMRQGDRIRRGGGRGGKRAAASSQPSLLSPVLIILIILMACLLVYLLFGDRILGMFQSDGSEDTQVEDVVPQQPDITDETDPSENDGTMPSDGDVEDPNSTDLTDESSNTTGMDYEKAAALPAGLTLSTTDFSLFNVGETHTIKVTGGTGTYTWFSEDEGVASVDSNGTVTAISKGDIQIVVTDGEKQGTCMVRVKVSGTSSGTTTAGSSTATATTAPKLSSTDFTIYVGDPDVKLSVSGVSSGITWSSKNTAVATVSSSGVVKAVGTGTTTVTASFNGQSLECVVRVPGSR